MRWEVLVLVAATLTMGLNAGLFYAFSMSVMPGLRRVDDRSFVSAMQQINVAILNGWFAVIFAGPGLLALLGGALQLGGDDRRALPWTGAAVAMYVGMLAVTFAVNVPLNNQLLRAGLPERAGEMAAVRASFEARWVRWNVIRAVASTASFGCLAAALVVIA